jgi:hypothetical protein
LHRLSNLQSDAKGIVALPGNWRGFLLQHSCN